MAEHFQSGSSSAPASQISQDTVQQLSEWVRRVSVAQAKKVTPERRQELLRQCEASRVRECSKRKAKAMKSHSVRTHALCADGLRQMASAGGNVQAVVAAQKRWSAAQEISEHRMISKASRWEAAEEEDRHSASPMAARVAEASDDEDEEEQEAMAEVAAVCGTTGGAAALASTSARDQTAFRQLLDQLRLEPTSDDEIAAKFAMYETYAGQVEKMRGNIFGIYEENRPTLPPMVEREMAGRLRAIDSEEAMGIADQIREWFVFHMMRTAERNNRGMEKVLEEFEKKLEFLATNEQTECPVCLESFEEAGAVRAPEVLSCGHRCCKECWANWVRVCSGRPFCPLCRNDEFVANIFAQAGEMPTSPTPPSSDSAAAPNNPHRGTGGGFLDGLLPRGLRIPGVIG